MIKGLYEITDIGNDGNDFTGKKMIGISFVDTVGDCSEYSAVIKHTDFMVFFYVRDDAPLCYEYVGDYEITDLRGKPLVGVKGLIYRDIIVGSYFEIVVCDRLKTVKTSRILLTSDKFDELFDTELTDYYREFYRYGDTTESVGDVVKSIQNSDKYMAYKDKHLADGVEGVNGEVLYEYKADSFYKLIAG